MISIETFGYKLLQSDAKEIKLGDKTILLKDTVYPITNAARNFMCRQLGVPSQSSNSRIKSALILAECVQLALKEGRIRNVTIDGCVNHTLNDISSQILEFCDNFNIPRSNATALNSLSHILLTPVAGPTLSLGHEKTTVLSRRSNMWFSIGEYGNMNTEWQSYRDIDIAEMQLPGPTKERVVAVLSRAARYFNFRAGLIDEIKTMKIAGSMDKMALMNIIGSVSVKMRRPNAISASEKATVTLSRLYSQLVGK
jgi:hypothetical protein